MQVQMVRYQVADDQGVAELARAVKAAFAALAALRPEGVRWAYYHRLGSAEFIAVLELDDGVGNPLPGIEAARQLQSTVARWAVEDRPAPQSLEVLGSYGFAS
jgi:hypothetical protein